MEQQTQVNWVNDELRTTQSTTYEKFPSLKLEEGKITEIVVDFSKPFESWKDPQSSAIKKIIPCAWNGVRHVFWLNSTNPLYREMLTLSKQGKVAFKIMRTGQAKATRYTLVKE